MICLFKNPVQGNTVAISGLKAKPTTVLPVSILYLENSVDKKLTGKISKTRDADYQSNSSHIVVFHSD